ncbi:hypothetical protein WR25_16299 [Diploscapter pachys]|uniref:Cytochrome P450 n=1 Tax=Diploscapter pachys TaxID=2018661 RepID=A0A2A2KIW6_9BILA|nr:hypothetical protein WR25_16299 [Diploscapter pachys]
MNGPLLLLITFTVIFAFYAKQIFTYLRDRRRLAKHMEKIIGIGGLPIIGSTWMFKVNVADATEQFIYWCLYFYRQNVPAGKLWVGTDAIIIPVKPSILKVLMQSNDLITKAHLYSILHPWLGTGLLTSTGQKWSDRRKLLTPAFHFNVLNGFLPTHDYQAKTFLEQIEKFAGTNREFDIFPYIKRMALDIICETSMGATVDAQHNHDHAYVNSVKRLNELIFKFNMYPFLRNKILRKISGFGDEFDYHLNVVTGFTKKVIEDKWQEYNAYEAGTRQEDKSRKKAFLDLLMDVRHEGHMNYEDVREEVDTFMFEGHDTTSSSMGWVLWSLACHPECQEKVIEEVDRIFKNSDRDCTNEDLKEMKYLEKCIKEGLRLFPAVPLYARQVEEDFEVDIKAPRIQHGASADSVHPPISFPDPLIIMKLLLLAGLCIAFTAAMPVDELLRQEVVELAHDDFETLELADSSSSDEDDSSEELAVLEMNEVGVPEMMNLQEEPGFPLMFVLDARRRDVKTAGSVPRRPEAKVESELREAKVEKELREARVGSPFRTDFAIGCVPFFC